MHEKINYKGWQNSIRLFNEKVDLVVTTDVGPRIIRFGFVGGANFMKEYTPMLGQTGGAEWKIYGGHRLWHAPEEKPRTYIPDNAPIAWKDMHGFIRFTQETEPLTHIQKEIDVTLDPHEAHATIVHRLYNHGLWAVELSVWSPTVTAEGGRGILPLPPRGTHQGSLLPVNTLTMWAYTDMADPRWTWGTRYILLQQDVNAKAAQKVGALVPDGWLGAVNHNNLFVKKIPYTPGAVYNDMGCNAEFFTDADMLEVESMGAVVKIEPGGFAEHVEEWYLFDGVPTPQNDADVEKYVLPKVKSIL